MLQQVHANLKLKLPPELLITTTRPIFASQRAMNRHRLASLLHNKDRRLKISYSLIAADNG
jgi:hypothetical protein